MQQNIAIRPGKLSGASTASGALAVGLALAITIAASGMLMAVPAPRSHALPARDVTPAWTQSGRVSWYGPGFHGRRTASGEIFDTNDLTMAHRTLPLGSRVKVTNLANGRSVVLRVNDRGPYVRGRVADLSHAAAIRLGFADDGVVRARIERI